jgi:hypothetical protein
MRSNFLCLRPEYLCVCNTEYQRLFPIGCLILFGSLISRCLFIKESRVGSGGTKFRLTLSMLLFFSPFVYVFQNYIEGRIVNKNYLKSLHEVEPCQCRD